MTNIQDIINALQKLHVRISGLEAGMMAQKKAIEALNKKVEELVAEEEEIPSSGELEESEELESIG